MSQLIVCDIFNHQQLLFGKPQIKSRHFEWQLSYWFIPLDPLINFIYYHPWKNAIIIWFLTPLLNHTFIHCLSIHYFFDDPEEKMRWTFENEGFLMRIFLFFLIYANQIYIPLCKFQLSGWLNARTIKHPFFR